MHDVLIGDKRSSLEKWAKKSKVNLDLAKALEMAIKEPEEAPYLLERIIGSFSRLKKGGKKETRNALLRVQIHCSINSSSDPIKVSKQLFVAQILEKLLFGSNLLLGEEIELEEHPARKRRKKR